MRRRPGYAAILILTLGLGIGATVSLTSVVNDLIVRPLPYADEDRVRVFWSDYDWRGAEYDFLNERRGVFDALAAFSTDGGPYHPTTRAEGPATALPYVVATHTLFDVLGVRPFMGHAFSADDDRPGAAPVAVISYGLWNDDLGRDPSVVGHRIMINGAAVTVIGVMPKGFFFPTPDFRVWRPIQLDPSTPYYSDVGYLTLLGRARPGTSGEIIAGDIRRMARDLGTRFTYPAAWDKTKHPSEMPVHQYLLGDVRAPLLLLLAAVAALLLIASVNGAALVLARMTDRTVELSVRTALGANHWRLARQIGAESLLVALGAAAAGTAFAAGGFRVLVSSLPLHDGFGETVSPGWVTLAAAFALALVISVVVSAVPVRNLLRGRFDEAFGRERGERALGRGTRRAHYAIIVAQVTLAVSLVVGATLLIRSVGRLREIDLGFDPQHTATLTLIASDNTSLETQRQFLRDVVTRVSALPGVQAAGLTNRLALRDGGYQGPVTVEDRPDLADKQRPNSLYRTATPGYFRAMGFWMLEGRGIDSTDVASSLPVTVINESFARKMWPGRSAIGRRIGTGWSGTLVFRTVVGVIREARLTGVTGDPPFAMFVPQEQHTTPNPGGVLVVRTTGDPTMLIPQVRAIAGGLDPQVAVARVSTLEQVVDGALAEPLQLRFFMGLFAALALTLGAVGVYGVVSFAVMRRRSEYGVRLALGASPSRVRWGVLRDGLAPVSLGVVLGVGAALVTGRALDRFLFGVSPLDPGSYLAAAGALLLAGGAGALIPAVRAARTSPARALRSE